MTQKFHTCKNIIYYIKNKESLDEGMKVSSSKVFKVQKGVKASTEFRSANLIKLFNDTILTSIFQINWKLLIKCWLWKNVNIVLLWISVVLGARWECMMVLSRKGIEGNKWEKVDFFQMRPFFTAGMVEASSKSWTKQGTYSTIKPLSCNR